MEYYETKAYEKYLEGIAEFLEVTIDKNKGYTNPEKVKNNVLAAELELVTLFRELDYDERKYIRKTLEYFAELK